MRCAPRSSNAPDHLGLCALQGWLGNGPSGWCLFKDGDAAHGCSWKGGSYGDFAIVEGSEVSVIFNADSRTVSFEVNGRLRADVYTDLPETVYLAISLYKSGHIELLSSDFAGPIAVDMAASDGGGGPAAGDWGPEQLLFGEGAGKIVEVSSEDGSRCGAPQHGLQPNTMAPITSDCDAMR